MWWSQWETKPAYTSAMRQKTRFSSSFSVSHGRTRSCGGHGWPLGPFSFA